MDFRLDCGSKGRHLTDKQDKSSKTLHMHRKCLPCSNVLMHYSTIPLQYSTIPLQYSTIPLQYVAQPLAPGEKSQNKSDMYLPCNDHFSAIFYFVSLNFGHKEYWFWATVISNMMCRISTFKYEKITIQSWLSKCMYVSVNLKNPLFVSTLVQLWLCRPRVSHLRRFLSSLSFPGTDSLGSIRVNYKLTHCCTQLQPIFCWGRIFSFNLSTYVP